MIRLWSTTYVDRKINDNILRLGNFLYSITSLFITKRLAERKLSSKITLKYDIDVLWRKFKWNLYFTNIYFTTFLSSFFRTFSIVNNELLRKRVLFLCYNRCCSSLFKSVYHSEPWYKKRDFVFLKTFALKQTNETQKINKTKVKVKIARTQRHLKTNIWRVVSQETPQTDVA